MATDSHNPSSSNFVSHFASGRTKSASARGTSQVSPSNRSISVFWRIMWIIFVFSFFLFFCKSKKKIQDGTRQSRINPTNSCSPSLSLSDDISRIYARVATGLRYESLIYLSFLVEEKYHHYSTEVTLKKCYERLNSGTFQRTRMKFSFRKILVIPPAQSTKLHGNRLIAPFPDLFRGIYIYIYKSRKQEGKQAVYERINYNNTVLT